MECQECVLRGSRAGSRDNAISSPIVSGDSGFTLASLQVQVELHLTEHAPLGLSQDRRSYSPRALEEVRSVVFSALTGDYQKLLEANLDVSCAAKGGGLRRTRSSPPTRTALSKPYWKADGHGMLFQTPLHQQQVTTVAGEGPSSIDRRWAFGCRHLPWQTTDICFSHNGQVFAGSGLIPEDWSISSLST